MIARIGIYTMALGVISIVLIFFNLNLNLLIWIDQWGTITGWIIRIGFVVLGGVIWFLGRLMQKR